MLKDLKSDDSQDIYTVWVGGAEVNDHLLSKEKADTLAKLYVEDGYDDVVVENTVEL